MLRARLGAGRPADRRPHGRRAPLRATFFDSLLAPDLDRDVLRWLNDPAAFRASLNSAEVGPRSDLVSPTGSGSGSKTVRLQWPASLAGRQGRGEVSGSVTRRRQTGIRQSSSDFGTRLPSACAIPSACSTGRLARGPRTTRSGGSPSAGIRRGHGARWIARPRTASRRLKKSMASGVVGVGGARRGAACRCLRAPRCARDAHPQGASGGSRCRAWSACLRGWRLACRRCGHARAWGDDDQAGPRPGHGCHPGDLLPWLDAGARRFQDAVGGSAADYLVEPLDGLA